MSQKILILFAHPAARRSRVNRALLSAVDGLDGVNIHDLYDAYPDFAIDVDREQALLADHDAVVLQHPFFWYSAPSIIKEWQDLVLEHGWAYGRNGDHLRGKTWMQAITTGGRGESYGPGGMNRFGIDDLLRPFEATASLCGMRWQPPFVVHAAHVADAATIQAAAQAYRTTILDLRDGMSVRAAG